MGLVYLYAKKMKLEFMEIVNVLMDTIILMEYVINVDQIVTMIQYFQHVHAEKDFLLIHYFLNSDVYQTVRINNTT